jgi:hypothetical protein
MLIKPLYNISNDLQIGFNFYIKCTSLAKMEQKKKRDTGLNLLTFFYIFDKIIYRMIVVF